MEREVRFRKHWDSAGQHDITDVVGVPSVRAGPA